MIVAVGTKGTGKTTLLRALVEAAARKGRVYVLDIHGAYDGIVVPRGAKVFPIAPVGRPVVYRPAAMARSDALAAASDALIRHVNGRGGTIVVDEVGAVRGPNVDRKPPPELGRIAVQGRHFPRAGAMVASQRMVHFWPETRTDADVIFAFRQFSGLDVDLLSESVPPMARNAVRAIVPTLPNLSYIRIDCTGAPLDLRPRRIDLKRRGGRE